MGEDTDSKKKIIKSPDGRRTFMIVGDQAFEKNDYKRRFKKQNGPGVRAYAGNRKWDKNIKDGRFQIQIGLDRSFYEYQDHTQKSLDDAIADFRQKTALEFVQCD